MKKIITRVCVSMMALALTASLLPMSVFAATVEAKLQCDEEVHEHDEGCYETKMVAPLTCELSTEGHTHGDECYAWGYGTETICNETETETVHQHGDGCYVATRLLVCNAGEHTHSDACQKTCSMEEHTHSEACGEDCAIPEHTHTAGCQMTCSAAEHTHSDSCYEDSRKLTCTQPDLPAHKHTEACYARVKGELICTKEEIPAHEHTDACYGEPEEQKVLVCDKQVHTHTAECYTNQAVVNGSDTGKTLEEALKDALQGSANDEITLILNGQVLNYRFDGADNMERGNAIVVKDGNTLNIEDAIGGGKIQGNGGSIRLIKVTGNGTVNLVSGTLTGGNGNGGGAVFVGGNGTLNMSGGQISGNKSQGNGGAVLVEGTFNMSGGEISNNSAPGQGGGVAVGPGGKFEMTGGTISKNQAGEGGGVFVDYNKLGGTGAYTPGSFQMDGGVIDGNIAHEGEGGGVYVKGNADITKGSITNNVTYTHKDLGGGGIYVEAEGVLTLKNAIITANTANGLGGGLAACVHGKTYVYALDGAVITGNNALGEGHSEGYQVNGQYNGGFIDGYTYWWDAKDIVKNAAQDIFAAGDSFEASFTTPGTPINAQGTAGILVSNTLPGADGATANWNGYTYCYVIGEDGKPLRDGPDGKTGNYIFEVTEVTSDNNGVVYGNRMVFLTANPDQESVRKAIEAMQNGVLIAGNLSANSHGGGIANNGVVKIGTGPMTGMDSSPAETEVTKNLTSNDENVTIANRTFEFQLTDKDGNVIGTVTNDENGKASFNFPPEYFNDVEFPEGVDEVEYVFYVTEINDGQANVTYDNTEYKVVIKITRTTETVRLGNEDVTVETLSIGEPEIFVSKLDADGNATGDYEAAPNGIEFDNTYTKPSNPGTPPETPKNPEPPETPEVPEEKHPVTEEFEEPEVPLAPEPETDEPGDDLVDIDDLDIPLADVPETGDSSFIWSILAVLSGIALVCLGLQEKKRKPESK